MRGGGSNEVEGDAERDPERDPRVDRRVDSPVDVDRPADRESFAHVRLDASGRVSSWNRIATDLLGYEAGEVVGTPLAELLPESVGDAWVEDVLDRAARRGRAVEKIDHVRRDGTRLETEITLTVARDADGECSGYLYAIRPTDGDDSPAKSNGSGRRWLWTLFERSPDSIVVHDADGEILQVNDQNVEDLGYTREELLSMNVADYEADHDLDELREIWEDMETGRREKVATRLRRKDGTTFPVDVWVTKLRVDGEPRFLALGRDVIERRERERELQELGERFELAIDGANLAVWDWDLRTDEVHYNDNWATMLGHDPDEIESHYEEWERRVHPDDLEAVQNALAEHVAGETEYYETEHRIETASGDWKWIRDIGRVFERDEDGEPVRAVGIHVDIDDRKRAERTLREERDMFAEGPVVVFKRRLESDWPIEYVSSNVESVFGHPEEELVGEGDYADLVHPQDRDDVESAIERRSVDADQFDVGPYRLYDADGDVRWVRETVKITREPTGVDRYLGYLVDVTERMESEQRLERQRETLKRIRTVSESIRPLNRALTRASTREEVISRVCEKLTQSSIYRFAWFGDYDPIEERVTPEDWAGIEDGYLDGLVIDLEDEEFVDGQVNRSIRNREVQATRNIASDPAFEPWRDAALERGYRSVASIPVVIEGNIHGVISVYSDRPNAFETYERELLGELGERVGHAIRAADRRQLLHAEAAQQLVFRTDDERSPFVDVSKRLGCRFELQTVIPTARSSYLGYVTVEGAAPEDVVEAFEQDDGIETARVISSDGTTGRVEYTVSTSPVATLLEYDVSVASAVIEDGEEIVHAEVAPETSTKPIVAGLQSSFDDVDLIAKRSVDRSARTPQSFRETIGEALTERQREILSLAFQAGYFESPRRSTGDELAETIGIAAPTFYVHVRRGTRNVLEQLDEFEILE